MAYDPPESNNIFFRFTERGYEAPTGELLFNFAEPGEAANLSAAIQVMQLYRDTTYTYQKYCPRYVIGYSGGAVQIIRGPCVFGGIRDLGVTLNILPAGSNYSDLSAYLEVGAKFKDLSAYLQTIPPEDLQAIIDSHDPSDIAAAIGTHLPKDLSAYLFADLGGIPLPAYIRGWGQGNVAALIATHSPRDLKALLRVRSQTYLDLTAQTRGWGAKNLSAQLSISLSWDLPAQVTPIPPSDLSAYLGIQPIEDLPAAIYGWGYKDLSAYMNITYFRDLPAILNVLDDATSNYLPARLKGVGSGYLDLGAVSQAMQYRDLSAYIKAPDLLNLPAYIFAIRHRNLRGIIHGWQELDLPALINAQAYPYDLTASIYPDGKYRDLIIKIRGVYATSVTRNFPAYIYGLDLRNLSAQIYSDVPGDLSASITSYLMGANLHASIRPKMIRLTTYVSIPTMERLDLSAIINAGCVYSASSNLGAYMYVKYKGDLNAYIRPIIYDYKPALLGASVGWADSYSEVDKYTFRITIKESEYFTEDKYRLLINILNQEHFLSASIRGTLQFKELSARIQAEKLPTYKYPTVSKNTEKVINRDYAGILKSYKNVEIAFEDVVKDYHYSPSGDYAWKTNQFQRWMLSVESFIPANAALSIYRKLYKATRVYNFAHFNSFDEAMRNAIAYVTEQPLADLRSSLQVIGFGPHKDLTAKIKPSTYVIEARRLLGGSITGSAPPIIIGTSSGIQKI